MIDGKVYIDRDTQGLAGAPDIGDSIYEKIDNADIFIADVTMSTLGNPIENRQERVGFQKWM